MPIRACSGAAVAGYTPARKKRARAQSASAARRRRAMLIPPSDRGSGFFVAMNEARRRQRRLAHRLGLLGPAHRDGEIVQPPVMDAVDQPVHLEGLAAPPSLLHDRGVQTLWTCSTTLISHKTSVCAAMSVSAAMTAWCFWRS